MIPEGPAVSPVGAEARPRRADPRGDSGEVDGSGPLRLGQILPIGEISKVG